MRFKAFVLLAIFSSLFVNAWADQPANLTDIKVSHLTGYTRITLTLDKQVDYTFSHFPSRGILTITLMDTKTSFPKRKLEVNTPQLKNLRLEENGSEIKIVAIEKSDKANQYRYFIAPGSSKLIFEIGQFSTSPSIEKAGDSKKYIISPQDVLKITVYGQPDLSQTVKISSSGTITFPLLGRVKVSGLTVSQVEKKLDQLLGEKYLVNPQVMVYVTESANIYILGQVKNPGVYKLRANLNVVEAITMAGGFTKIAYRNKTKVIRSTANSKKTIKVPVGDIIKKGDKNKDIKLQAGDVIVVPESFF